jgi:hypothetical protein
MKVPDQLLEKWNAMRDRNDIVNLMDESGISRHIINKAFAQQDITMESFTIIADYYEKKIKVVKSYVQ